MFTVYILYFIKGNDEKQYIGRTSNFDRRLKRHLKTLKDGTHHNEILQLWYNEGYRYNEKPKLVTVSSLEDAKQLEKELISDRVEKQCIVNIELGGDTHTAHPRREEISKLKSERQSAFIANLSAPDRVLIYGQPGKKNGMYKRKHTPGTVALISAKVNEWYKHNASPNKGRIFTTEHRAKISHVASQRVGDKNPFYGKRHNDATRKRLSEAQKGKLPPNVRKVSVVGKTYESITAAGRALNLNTSVVLWRIKSNNKRFADWKWLDKCPTTRA